MVLILEEFLKKNREDLLKKNSEKKPLERFSEVSLDSARFVLSEFAENIMNGILVGILGEIHGSIPRNYQDFTFLAFLGL